MIENIKLVLISFTASFGLGITAHIKKEYLPWAGLGGALTRICYLILLEFIDSRLFYSLFAAMFAALYAEILAMKFKVPSTVFLYPTVIPLAPGSLIYATAVNLLLQDIPAMRSAAKDCALTLFGVSIGFVLISTFSYYRRLYFLGKDLASHLRRHPYKR